MRCSAGGRRLVGIWRCISCVRTEKCNVEDEKGWNMMMEEKDWGGDIEQRVSSH